MVVIPCKECKDLFISLLTLFWNITDFGHKCPRCEAIKAATLENEELEKQVLTISLSNSRKSIPTMDIFECGRLNPILLP